MLLDREVEVSHISIYKWILKVGPELEQKFRKPKLPTNLSWRVDETYIKVRGVDRYLYRAVDKCGNTIDFLLTAKRDLKAARRSLVNFKEYLFFTTDCICRSNVVCRPIPFITIY